MRLAMSMIELVISIVVMGIVVMSLPLILTQVQNNNAFALQQESILAAQTTAGSISTYAWDKDSFDATNPKLNRLFVLDVPAGDDDFNRSNGTTQRRGHIGEDGRRKFHSVITNANNINNANLDSVDIFHNKDTDINTSTEDAKTLDYILDSNLILSSTLHFIGDDANYNSDTINNFIFDNVGQGQNNPSNIKMIKITAKDGNKVLFNLYTYTFNIGESIIQSRPYQ
ncbi:MAG: hypothetical protein LRY68_08460 [Sulfurospirillum sp.]|nr:hypothetical protein [Sulfurospirillum sp.]